MPFCSDCGAEVDESAKFCPACGRPVSGEEAEATLGAGSHVSMRRAIIGNDVLREEITSARHNEWGWGAATVVGAILVGVGIARWYPIRDCLGDDSLNMPLRCVGVDVHPQYELYLTALIVGVIIAIVGLAMIRRYNTKVKKLIAQLRELENRDHER